MEVREARPKVYRVGAIDWTLCVLEVPNAIGKEAVKCV